MSALPQPHAGSQAGQSAGGSSYPRGYLTNLFDVADPGAELPRCSDHSDQGETQALLLLRLLAGAGFSRCQAATQSAGVGLRVTPERRSRRLRRAPGGCYGDGRVSDRCSPRIRHISSVRTAADYRPGNARSHVRVSELHALFQRVAATGVLARRREGVGGGVGGACTAGAPHLPPHIYLCT